MPKVQDLDTSRILANPVVNQDRRMSKLANTWRVCYWTADVGKAFQYVEVVEESVSKALRRIREISPGISQYLLKIS